MRDHRLQLSASRPWSGRSKKKKKKEDYILLYKKAFKHIFPSTQLAAGLRRTNSSYRFMVAHGYREPLCGFCAWDKAF